MQRGSLMNVSYSDFIELVLAFGFVYRRQRGSHRYYRHPAVPKRLDLQPVKGEAKPYQIRQFLDTIQEYGLTMED